jgi:hypothetical protein
MKKITKLTLSLLSLAMHLQSLHADAGQWVEFSDDRSVVEVKSDGIAELSGASSAVFSIGEKRQRIGTKGTQLLGAVRESTVATPFGNADLLQATYGRADFPFQYTLKLKYLRDVNAFTVQAVIHNRSSEDIRLHNFDLFDARKGQGGALNVTDASQWLVTPLKSASMSRRCLRIRMVRASSLVRSGLLKPTLMFSLAIKSSSHRLRWTMCWCLLARVAAVRR